MSRQPPNSTDLDDWETDPDFVREMDEMDQRWGGNKRTVGSINMNELIEDVRREHRNLREKFRDASRLNDFPSRGEFVRNVSPTSANSKKLLNEEESSSKLSTKEIKREVIRSETSSYIKESNGSRLTSETVRSGSGSPQMRSFTTTTTTSTPTSPPTATAATAAAASVRRSPIPPIAPKPALSDVAARLSRGRVAEAPTEPMKRYETDTIITTDPPQQFKGGLVSKSIFRQEKSPAPQSSRSPSSGGHPTPPPPAQAFSKSIQDRIEAFKKEFDDIEHNVARKSDISKVIKKTTTTTTSGNNDRKLDDVSYITRSNDKLNSARSPPMRQSPDSGARSTSAASFAGDDSKPRANIKSLSERFETLGRESSDDFKRRMEERRREFFDRIKTQVRETRKGLDGFDIDDSDEDAERVGAPAGGGMRQFVTKLHSPTSQLYGSQASRLSGDSLGSQRPKVYSRRETTKEEVVSRLVKENDKVVHDETKRNVERSSSCHGSSDDDEDEDGREEPSSIKFLDRELRSSPQQRTQSPSIDEIKRKVPVVEEPVVGAGLMARTLYDYQASEEDELCFDVDDLITNIEKVDQGWYRGAITKQGVKRVGLFPANYVKILNDTSEY